MKNDHYPIETTVCKNNTVHTTIVSMTTKISKCYPHF